jgi:PIN domain nuclease of toxin-antitoxin system
VKYLIDTQIFIWSLKDRKQINPKIWEILLSLDNDIYLSMASMWEIAIKETKGRLEIPTDPLRAAQSTGLEIMDIKYAHIQDIKALPNIHSDPFDRLIIATARCEKMQIITSDKAFKHYDVGVIEAI